MKSLTGLSLAKLLCLLAFSDSPSCRDIAMDLLRVSQYEYQLVFLAGPRGGILSAQGTVLVSFNACTT